MESFTRKKVQQRTHFRFDKSRLWRKIVLMERDSKIAICRGSDWMDRSATCVNLFADFDNETENRLKLGSENCLGEHGRSEEKKWKPFFRKWNFQSLSSIVAASCSLWFIRCATFSLRLYGLSWTSSSPQETNLPEGGPWRIMTMQGEMWFIDTQHRFTGMAADSFVRFNYDDRWSELVSFVFNAWTHDIGFWEIGGENRIVVVWLWRITVRVESQWCHGDFS